ncbi:type II 3-dehydroquinate dehydratase [Nocardia sp. NPDC003963]
MPSVLVLNGPNLDLLGSREPGHYGSQTLQDVERLCRGAGADLQVDVDCRQSNHEGELIDWVHETAEGLRAGTTLGAVVNPGALAHTSIALRDAIVGVQLPVIELHISNVYARETFRHRSFIAPVAAGIVAGLGIDGYEWALRALVRATARLG